MSESSSGGESSYNSSESSSINSIRARVSTPSSILEQTNQEPPLNLVEIKDKLRVIELFVKKNLNNTDQMTFVKIFRQLIVDNEQQVSAFPTAAFFISKFEELDSPILTEELKTQILTDLYEKQNEEKHNKSKLKYW